MFDCVMPTRNGRHGARLHALRRRSICATRATPTIRGRSTSRARARPRATYSRAYLHHLMRANEMLGAMLLSEINLAYYQELMPGMRAAIGAGAVRAISRRDARSAGTRGDIPAL